MSAKIIPMKERIRIHAPAPTDSVTLEIKISRNTVPYLRRFLSFLTHEDIDVSDGEAFRKAADEIDEIYLGLHRVDAPPLRSLADNDEIIKINKSPDDCPF